MGNSLKINVLETKIVCVCVWSGAMLRFPLAQLESRWSRAYIHELERCLIPVGFKKPFFFFFKPQLHILLK